MILCTCMQHAANTQHNTQHAGGVVEYYNIIKYITSTSHKNKNKNNNNMRREDV